MGLIITDVAGGGGTLRTIPKKTGDSFIYWDMLTKPDGSKLVPGEQVTAAGGVKNQGYGGSAGGLDLTTGNNTGDGVPIACSGPTGGGVDFGGTGAGKGSIATASAGVYAPQADDDVVMSIACRLRAGGVGSPVLFTKSYIAPGGGWSSPFNAFGPSFSSALDGTCTFSVNVGGADQGITITDRYALPFDTDLWIDFAKRADGTAAIWVNATKIKTFNPGLLTDWGHGEWMLGGNIHTSTDSINGQLYFAELVTANLTDAQITARAKAWLGWA